MENNINFKFKELGNKLKLSKTEKDFHREEILRFVNQKISIQTPYYKEEKILPFYISIFTGKYLVFTSLVIVAFLSTGIVVSAEQALPNDYLYQMKIKIIEPTKILLAPTVEKKNNLRVEFVDNALKDFSQISLKEDVNPSDKSAIIDSISSNIKDVNNDISKQVGENNTSNSLETANNLRSVLSAHSIVLDKISETNPEVDNTDTLSTKINEGLNTTDKTINTLVNTIQTSKDPAKIDQTISDQKEDINTIMKDIKNVNSDNLINKNQNIKRGNQSEKINIIPKDTIYDSVNNNTTNKRQDNALGNIEDNKKQDIVSSDKTNVDVKLSEINAILKEGDQKLSEGKKDEAFILYNQTDQKLGELKSLIDSENKLNIGVINSVDNNIENQPIQ